MSNYYQTATTSLSKENRTRNDFAKAMSALDNAQYENTLIRKAIEKWNPEHNELNYLPVDTLRKMSNYVLKNLTGKSLSQTKHNDVVVLLAKMQNMCSN